MALGIDETTEDGLFLEHLVYKEGVKVKYPDSKDEIIAAILPALADKKDKKTFRPYRDEEDGKFTKWAVGLKVHRFVGREQNIISPATFDPKAWDPISDLYDVLASTPEWKIIVGLGPDGKPIKEAYKDERCRLAKRWTAFVVNAMILDDPKIKETEVHLLQIPGTAFRNSMRRGSSSSSWGLISELNRKNRRASSKGDEEYYWGDITNPDELVPCSLKLDTPPSGGFPIYNMTPLDADTVQAPDTVLEARYDLDEVFLELTEGEIIDRLLFYFSDLPDALIKAFGSRIPTIKDRVTKISGVRRQAEEETDGDELFEDDEMQEPPKRRSAQKSIRRDVEVSQEEAQSFAPPEDTNEEEAAPPRRRASVSSTPLEGPSDNPPIPGEESKPTRKRRTASSTQGELNIDALLD